MKVKIILDDREKNILHDALLNPYIKEGRHPCENCPSYKMLCECDLQIEYGRVMKKVEDAGLLSVLEDIKKIRALERDMMKAKEAVNQFGKELREKYVGADSIFFQEGVI